MTLLKLDKLVYIEKQSIETIYEEIVQYLKTCRSEYFEFDPKEFREEVILRMFERSTSESLRNKLRQSVYIAIEREELFLHGFEFISSLLELIDGMKVTQAKNILLEMARAQDFPGISPGNKAKLKNRVIGILLKFDIYKEALKEIIDLNISDPDYTETCLAASTRLIPRFDSFVKYFPTALDQYRNYPQKISLDSVLRVCLDNIGKAEWQARGHQLLLCDLKHMDEILRLFDTAELDLLLYPIDRDESSFVFVIKWPFDGKSVYTYLFNLTDLQKEALQEAIYKSWGTSSKIGETDIGVESWLPLLEKIMTGASIEQNVELEEGSFNLPINFIFNNSSI